MKKTGKFLVTCVVQTALLTGAMFTLTGCEDEWANRCKEKGGKITTETETSKKYDTKKKKYVTKTDTERECKGPDGEELIEDD